MTVTFSNLKVSLSKIERKKKRRSMGFQLLASVLVLIQLVLTVLFLSKKCFKLDILPFKYLFMINIILILLVLYDFTSQFHEITSY